MKQGGKQPPFYALDADLPLILAISSGLQHALAMLAGLITPPIIFASSLSLDAPTSAYMISASLIGCGTFSLCAVIELLSLLCFRYVESCPNVTTSSFPWILPRYWLNFCGWNELCYAVHCQRGLFIFILVSIIFISYLPRFLMPCTRMEHVRQRQVLMELSLVVLVQMPTACSLVCLTERGLDVKS